MFDALLKTKSNTDRGRAVERQGIGLFIESCPTPLILILYILRGARSKCSIDKFYPRQSP